MDLNVLFEQAYADRNDMDESEIRSHRMSNGSYDVYPLARCFRWFCAGFESNTGDKIQILGYLSNKGVLSAQQSKGVFFNTTQTDAKSVAVYIKQSNTLKTGENHGKQ